MRLADRVPAGSNRQKSLHQASNPKIAGYLVSTPKLGGHVYYNNIVGTLLIHLCPSHMERELTLPGVVSSDVLRITSLRITLAVPEVAGTENWVTSNIPLLVDPSSITKTQS